VEDRRGRGDEPDEHVVEHPLLEGVGLEVGGEEAGDLLTLGQLGVLPTQVVDPGQPGHEAVEVGTGVGQTFDDDVAHRAPADRDTRLGAGGLHLASSTIGFGIGLGGERRGLDGGCLGRGPLVVGPGDERRPVEGEIGPRGRRWPERGDGVAGRIESAPGALLGGPALVERRLGRAPGAARLLLGGPGLAHRGGGLVDAGEQRSGLVGGGCAGEAGIELGHPGADIGQEDLVLVERADRRPVALGPVGQLGGRGSLVGLQGVEVGEVDGR
jgi:hypothetical protein